MKKPTQRELIRDILTRFGAPLNYRELSPIVIAFGGRAVRPADLSRIFKQEEQDWARNRDGCYVCKALGADLSDMERLAPMGGIVTLSNWPLERRAYGSLTGGALVIPCARWLVKEWTAAPENEALRRLARNVVIGTSGAKLAFEGGDPTEWLSLLDTVRERYPGITLDDQDERRRIAARWEKESEEMRFSPYFSIEEGFEP